MSITTGTRETTRTRRTQCGDVNSASGVRTTSLRTQRARQGVSNDYSSRESSTRDAISREPKATVSTRGDIYASAALRERSTSLAPTPSRKLVAPKRPFQRTLGSRQVVSVRGRRVVTKKTDPSLVRLIIGGTIAGGLAIFAAMGLAGVSTNQAFELQQLTAQESQLNNQIETLNRDLEAARSAAQVAKDASEKGMVVADQPGILAVENNGNVTEQRPAVPEATRPIIDVNGNQVRPNMPTSNPNETSAVTNNLAPLPQSGAQVPAPIPAVAPYQPRVRDTAQAGDQ